jgi:hypothetical protein
MAENQSLYEREVFDIVEKPKGAHLLGSRYIHVIKRKLGAVDRRKTRLVVLGCSQRAGLDYGETFAPVAKASTIRILFALAQVYSLQIHQMDVETAFLYAPLKEVIYMKPPSGMKDVPKNHCLQLRKSLYGLKQAPTNFNQHIDEFIRNMGFVRCVLDNCLYVMMLDHAKIVLALYVDDIIILGDNLDVINDVKDSFKDSFQMKDLGVLTHYLGMRITREHNVLKVDQTQYAKDVVQKFTRLMSTNSKKYKKNVPFYRDMKLTRTERMSKGQTKYAKNFPYQEVMGSLLYLAINTRPDISYAVNVLCRFNSSPTYSACRSAVRLLHYIKATLDYGIQYTGNHLNVEGWSDSDWGGDLDTRRSTTGYTVRIANGPVSWKSCLQSTLASSVMEAEYMASYDVVQELVWAVGVCKEISVDLLKNGPINVYMDNKSAIALANNPVHHKRSKHIDIKYHWLREKIAEGVVNLVYVRSEDQLADIFTKGLAYPRFMVLVYRVRGVYDVYAVSDIDSIMEMFWSDSD